MTPARGTLHPIGSRVRLASGGPDMLVVDLDPVRREVIVAWRDGSAVSERTFQNDTLEPVTPA